MSEDNIDSSMSALTESELMHLIHSDSDFWIRALDRSDEQLDVGVLQIKQLIGELWKATQAWAEPGR